MAVEEKIEFKIDCTEAVKWLDKKMNRHAKEDTSPTKQEMEEYVKGFRRRIRITYN